MRARKYRSKGPVLSKTSSTWALFVNNAQLHFEHESLICTNYLLKNGLASWHKGILNDRLAFFDALVFQIDCFFSILAISCLFVFVYASQNPCCMVTAAENDANYPSENKDLVDCFKRFQWIYIRLVLTEYHASNNNTMFEKYFTTLEKYFSVTKNIFLVHLSSETVSARI